MVLELQYIKEDIMCKCEDCGADNDTVYTAPCPFRAEVLDDNTEVDLCENCRYERWLEV